MKVFKMKSAVGAVVLTCVGLLAANATPQSNLPSYRIDKKIALGGGTHWDFLTYDPTSNRVYVTHGDRIDVVDVGRGARAGVISGIDGGPHGVVIKSPSEGFTDDGDAGTLVPFNPDTYTTKPPIKVGADADAIVIDPLTHKLFVVDSDPGTITVVDPVGLKKLATIEASGKLEYPVADDRGHLFVNGEGKREILRIDTRTEKIDARWPMPECESPHGLALDKTTRRLFSGCANERVMVVDAETGSVVTKMPIGRGSDGIAFDPVRRRILSANGLDGTLSVIQELGPDTFVSLRPIETAISGRTLAVDAQSGRVFVAAAATDPAPSPGGRPIPRPGTLALLILEPAR